MATDPLAKVRNEVGLRVAEIREGEREWVVWRLPRHGLGWFRSEGETVWRRS